jgi:antitoxin (DNA-binding transcriptional repressor) of toxin-antitoxin stability system
MPAANLADMDPRLAKLIDAALRGEEVVLARGGVPVAKLVAIEPKRPRRREPGRFEGQGIEHDPDWGSPTAS